MKVKREVGPGIGGTRIFVLRKIPHTMLRFRVVRAKM